MRKWGELIAVTLLSLLHGESLHQAISAGCEVSALDIDPQVLETLIGYPDATVVGRHFSSAGYEAGPPGGLMDCSAPHRWFGLNPNKYCNRANWYNENRTYSSLDKQTPNKAYSRKLELLKSGPRPVIALHKNHYLLDS